MTLLRLKILFLATASIVFELGFFYLAACHHPDFVEVNKSTAWHTNVTAYANFLNELPASVDLLYVSTDNVYGESSGLKAFAEQDQTLPLNEYGKQKLVAENLTLSRGHNVVRCSFLIGPAKTSKQHFYDQIVAALRTKQELKLLADSYRSAISFNQVAEFLISLSDKFQGQQYGIVNIGGDKPLTKFDVGSLIAEKENLSVSPLLKIGYDDQIFFKAKRAKDIIIDNRKLKRLLELESISLSF